MKIPTIPHDKALHAIYGMLVFVVSCLIGLAIARYARLPLLLAPIAGIALSGLIGKLAEMRQERLNAQAQRDGLPGAHDVDPADVRYTTWGGVLASLPVFLALTLR